jgi:molecular chaperone Hsp33
MEPVQDICLPFTLDSSNLRGRFVRLGASLQEIVTRHNYPAPVNHLLAELTGLTVLLASSLKVEGRFTLQTSSDGAVPMLVVDMASTGEIRATARIEQEKLDAAIAEQGDAAVMGSVPKLMGAGHLAFTIDQDGGEHRYQGMVSLEGETLADCAEQYFSQSEQLDTKFLLKATVGNGPRESWVGGFMLQRLPVGSDDRPLVDAEEIVEEDWSRACILLESVTEAELLDIALPPEDLVYRLFHEEKPRGYPATSIKFSCTCSREKIIATLSQFPREEVLAMRDEGSEDVVVTCEFCSYAYRISPDELAAPNVA